MLRDRPTQLERRHLHELKIGRSFWTCLSGRSGEVTDTLLGDGSIEVSLDCDPLGSTRLLHPNVWVLISVNS